MSTSIMHSLTRSGARSHCVTAPGWVPASLVLESVDRLTAAELSPESAPGPAAGASATTVTSSSITPDRETWAQWTATRPSVVHGVSVPFLPPATPTPPGHARLVVRAGPESGFAIALPQGEWTLGRGAGADVPLADPFLSRTPHALANSPAGITVDGVSEHDGVLGSTVLTLPVIASPDRPPETLDWPERQDVAGVRTPSWLVYAAPVVIGIVLALVVGTWWFLLLSVAGPLTAVLTLRADRRRFARETARAAREHRRAIDRTLQRLEASLHHFALEADRFAYGGGPLAGPGIPPGSTSRADPSAGRDRVMVLGLGNVVSTVAVRLPRDRDTREQTRRRLPPHSCQGDLALLIAPRSPLLVDRESTVRIDGPEAAVRSVARSVVAAHLAAGSGCVGPAGFPEFSGLSGLPRPCMVQVSAPERDGPTRTRTEGPARLTVVVRGPDAPEDAPVIAITCGPVGQPGHISVPAAAPSSPVHVAHTAGPASPTGRHPVHPAFGRPLSGPAHLHSLSRASAIRLLATIAPRTTEGARTLPRATQVPTTGIADLLHLWDTTGQSGHGPLAAPLGTPVELPGTTGAHPSSGTPLDSSMTAVSRLTTHGSSDVFVLDLRTSGPHALIAGTTGSGKSVLLETWLEALCRSHSPDDLRLILLDFKGGASLSRFLARPHTDCLLTDLDETAALRALRSITAEVERRERHLAEAGCRDIDSLLDRSRVDPTVQRLPRLLVVIDEFHVLTGLGPHVVAQFERLTAVGRSLGVHIVLSTQRPSGVVSARMRANIALRICLRVRDDADSREVLGIPDAAQLDAQVPGVALVSDESGIRGLRCAVPDDPHPVALERPIPHAVVRSLQDDAEVSVPLPCPSPPAARTWDGPRGPRHEVIAAPLPDLLTAASPEDDATVGLADLPQQNRTAGVELTEASGSFTVSGGRGRGWTTAVGAIARAFAATGLPVVRLDSARAGDTEGLPLVDPAGILRLPHAQGWMIDHLLDICTVSAEPVVWAIDDWDELTHAHPAGPRIERLERLLSGSARMRFVVSAPRRGLGARLSQSTTTRIIFPPAADTDVVLFGLSATRFRGEWPPGRAVILGDAAQTDDRDGADIQFLQRADRAGCAPQTGAMRQTDACEMSVRAHPLWTDFAPHPLDSARRLPHVNEAIAIGLDPGGREVCWSPDRDGVILTVRCLPPRGASPSHHEASLPDCDREMQALTDTLSARGIAVIDEREDRRPDPRGMSAAGPICVLAGTPGLRQGGLTGEATTGPTLLLGDWREADLRAAGHRWLAPIPPTVAAHWWLSGETTTPVRLLSRAPASSTTR